jgi:hypothetical protein
MDIRVPDLLDRAPDVIVSAQLRAWRWSVSSVIVGGAARTPIGKPLRGFKDVSATDLGDCHCSGPGALEFDALIITVPADGNSR